MHKRHKKRQTDEAGGFHTDERARNRSFQPDDYFISQICLLSKRDTWYHQLKWRVRFAAGVSSTARVWNKCIERQDRRSVYFAQQLISRSAVNAAVLRLTESKSI